jgi:hypothetical protein
MSQSDDLYPFGQLSGPSAETSETNAECYIDQYPHGLPHRATAQVRPCGHRACDPHTITYFGSGEANDAREGDYCLVCYERTFPGRCPDRMLRAALAG